MTQRGWTYLGISAVGIISAMFLVFTENPVAIEFLISLPMVGSLFAALYQFLRDQLAHDRALLLQDAKNRFLLGVSSHMGNTAFDKHVEFSEAYVEKARFALKGLFHEGPTQGALADGWSLREVRHEYAIWLTSDLEKALFPFEQALISIGADAVFIEAVRGSAKDHKVRDKAIANMYQNFAEVMGFKEWKGQPITDELAIEALVRILRVILGIEELASLRAVILKEATHELRSSG